ncbi:monovalent cation/H+ antiporter subunit D [Halomonas heilongjiangensis]|uniref:Monovalent cation/H+ antiporter subunit D n=1 Tax=Halomonas heilongjiangensis TaxID=1387883 RepID=A0A2N7TPI4_9GAMM|nr:monovalent cation/H+ antiporter subunit D [Halomonas heilongjiangensis]PMR70018.1 monovalent cation/H+ antiporter subunit D [Halomonas heilongjiangensis]PXX94382.1 monovalent cation/H+ antiporter subunit D [Halomonas heilongjiangensis]
MSQHLLVLPILVPLIGALALLLTGKVGHAAQRRMGVALTALLVVISAGLLARAGSGELTFYALGNWQAPFGIVLMLDRLSALMLTLTAVLALGCVLFACAGDDARGSNFHGLFQLQLMGLNGAFLTGDLFNLFVFFEILLLASYALLMHGGGKARVGAGLHYVILNLAGSALFLVALGVLYGATGTLNMADMARRLATMSGDETALVTAGALLLIVVFSLKAALLPLYFWLPRTYSAALAPVAALFAIMTKVGLYAILRVQSLIFADSPVAEPVAAWLWWSGLATIALAGIGVLAARDLRPLIAYLVLVSVGTLLAATALATPQANTALLYYLLHTTLICGALYLIAELIGQQRGKAGTRLVRARRLHQRFLLGGFFLVAAVAVSGLPPLAGALGKLLLLQAAEGAARLWLWPLLLLAGLSALIAMSRAGSVFFWASYKGEVAAGRVSRAQLAGVIWLLASAPLLVGFGGPVSDYTRATAEQLADPGAKIAQLFGDESLPHMARFQSLEETRR